MPRTVLPLCSVPSLSCALSLLPQMCWMWLHGERERELLGSPSLVPFFGFSEETPLGLFAEG